jgi:hypothetical protein
MSTFDLYITLIFIVKILFIIISVSKLYITHKEPNNKKKIDNLEFWKKRIEFIFILLMSILLIYLFNPLVNRINRIDNETKLLLYLFGFVLILTSDWNQFTKDSRVNVFLYVKNVLGIQ